MSLCALDPALRPPDFSRPGPQAQAKEELN